MDPRPEWMQCLQRAFAMLALAIISANVKRTNLKEFCDEHDEFSVVPMPTRVAEKLSERVLRGDVTSIVPTPTPFWFIYWNGSYGSLRCVWGLWLERPASWRGKPQQVETNFLTRDQAEQLGIPMPDESPASFEEV